MNDEDLKKKIKNSMDQMAEGISIQTQVKLNEARYHAINNSTRPKRQFAMWSALGASGAAVFMLVFLLASQESPKPISDEPALFEDLELLAGEVDTDFYQELEFISWLDENNVLDSDI